MPPNHRPQTLKQVKTAYRKSGATVRLSESELAIIERRSVLQERADRIKEREARRKANIRRKEERNQREREARARMSIKELVKEGITHVGPSQLSLGSFLGAGAKRKRGIDEGDGYNGFRIMTGATRAETKDEEEKERHIPPIQRTPWRNPLKVISAGSISHETPPEDSAAASTLTAKDPGLSSMAPPPSSRNCFQPKSPLSGIQQQMPPEPAQRISLKNPNVKSYRHGDRQVMVMAPPPSRTPLQVSSPKPLTQPKPLHQTKGNNTSTIEEVKIEHCQTRPMASLPQRATFSRRTSTMNTQQKPSITAPQTRLPDTVDECWDEFFVSGTQIARELSPPTIKTVPDAAPVAVAPSSHTSASPPMVPKNEIAYPNTRTVPTPPPSPPLPSQFQEIPPTIKDDTSGLLALLSTQDLDFSGLLTQASSHIADNDTPDLLAQISTQDLDFSIELTQAAPQAPTTLSSDFDEDLTEEDLEDVALEFERESTIAKSKTTTPYPQRPSTNNSTRIEGWDDDDINSIYYSDFLGCPPTAGSVNSNGNKSEDEAYNNSDEQWDDFNLESSYKIGEITAEKEIEAEQMTKLEMDVKPCVSRSCSQEFKLAADYDAFDLSTQDLRDFEYESSAWIP